MPLSLTSRPLTAHEILDGALLLMARRPQLYFSLSLPGAIPIALLAIAYQAWLGSLVTGTPDRVFWSGTAAWAAAMSLAWGWNCLARGAVTAAALADSEGEIPTLKASWVRAIRAAPASLLAGWSGLSLGFLGLLAGVYPGLALTTAWWVARPVAIQEGRTHAAALRRSARLTLGHRSRGFGVWVLIVLLYLAVAFNLHLLLVACLDLSNFLLAIDTTAARAQLTSGNELYTTVVLSVAYLLIEPLKSAADALYYLDLRVRREGGDLEQRLSRLSSAAAAAAVLLLVLVLSPRPAFAAEPADQYLARIRKLRAQVETRSGPGALDPGLVRKLRSAEIERAGAEEMRVRNDWLSEREGRWRSPAERTAVAARLSALERVVAAPPGGASRRAGPTGMDPGDLARQMLQQPRFLAPAERTELRRLGENVRVNRVSDWQKGFLEWLARRLFPQQEAAGQVGSRRPEQVTTITYMLIALCIVVFLALILRWYVQNPMSRRAKAAGGAGPAAPLSASQTEDALAHTEEDWRRFARAWQSQGDLRQAARAIYLATLVHLHDSGLIRYHRALTNWTYVRHFRGSGDDRGRLGSITREFDEIWYGERPCDQARYQRVLSAARDLGTPLG